jgi:DNA-binding NarL/FixJ family response regulator
MDIRVFLIDDHAAIRRALHDLLEAEVNLSIVGETGNGFDVVKQTAQIRPDVVVLDVSMPGIADIETAQQISEISPETQVILLSMHLSREHALQALRAGANGYVLKESAGAEIVNAIRTVLDGGVYLSPEVTQLVGQYA